MVEFPGVNEGAVATIVRPPLHLPASFGEWEGWYGVVRTDLGTFRQYCVHFDEPQVDEGDDAPYVETLIDERAFEIVP